MCADILAFKPDLVIVSALRPGFRGLCGAVGMVQLGRLGAWRDGITWCCQ
jgi:hypothetical protein